jgi:hypothetical protein
MNVTGGHHMNDDNELSEVRESLLAEGTGLAGVHMDRPAQAVLARGQTLRLRRRLLRGLSGVTAASVALALALTLPGGGAGLRQVHVNEADWSVNTGQHGTVTVMVKAVPDPVRLQTVLIEAGVPTQVLSGQNCREPVRPLPPRWVVVKRIAATYKPLPRVRHVPLPSLGTWHAWTIRPTLLPAHTSFVFGGTADRHHPRYHNLVWAFAEANAHVSCTHARPTSARPATVSPRPHATCIAVPQAAPSPSPTPKPHATPSLDPTPKPHATPSPGPTPSSQATPSSEPTPSSHATPSPRETPTPQATPSPLRTCVGPYVISGLPLTRFRPAKHPFQPANHSKTSAAG